jgi:hypothetical protein
MSERDLEAIISEILENAAVMTSRKRAVGPMVKGGNGGAAGRKMGGARGRPYVVRRREPRPQRKPLRNSLRLIFLGLVVLCIPLLFSV